MLKEFKGNLVPPRGSNKLPDNGLGIPLKPVDPNQLELPLQETPSENQNG